MSTYFSSRLPQNLIIQNHKCLKIKHKKLCIKITVAYPKRTPKSLIKNSQLWESIRLWMINKPINFDFSKYKCSEGIKTTNFKALKILASLDIIFGLNGLKIFWGICGLLLSWYFLVTLWIAIVCTSFISANLIKEI